MNAILEHDFLVFIIGVVVLSLIGVTPIWGYSRKWGYGPAGGTGILLIVLVILLLTGHKMSY